MNIGKVIGRHFFAFLFAFFSAFIGWLLGVFAAELFFDSHFQQGASEALPKISAFFMYITAYQRNISDMKRVNDLRELTDEIQGSKL